jgi:putative acetyltransferase
VDDFVIEAEQDADHAPVDDVVRRAFARAEVAEMVAAIRASPRFRPGFALVARVGDTVAGFVMLSGTDLVDAGVRREVLTLTPLAVAPEYERRGIGWAREGAQVYLLSSYGPHIRGRVEYPPEIAAATE